MKHILSLILTAALLAGCSEATVEQASEDFNQLPEAVQKATREQKPNAEVASVTKEDRSGTVVYQIRFRNEELHPPLEVAADGTIIKYERPVARGGALDDDRAAVSGGGSDISALPLPVQEAIRENAPRAEVVNVQRQEENGRRVYIIEYAGQNRRPQIRVTDDGKLVKE